MRREPSGVHDERRRIIDNSPSAFRLSQVGYTLLRGEKGAAHVHLMHEIIPDSKEKGLEIVVGCTAFISPPFERNVNISELRLSFLAVGVDE